MGAEGGAFSTIPGLHAPDLGDLVGQESRRRNTLVVAEGEELHHVGKEGGQEGRGARQGLRAGSRASEQRGLWAATLVSLSHADRQHPRQEGHEMQVVVSRRPPPCSCTTGSRVTEVRVSVPFPRLLRLLTNGPARHVS